MKSIKIVICFIFVLGLTSCLLFRENYKPARGIDISECVTGEVINNFGLFETAGLIEHGYDVPVFDGDDEAGIVVCEDDLGVEKWFFHVEYDDEITIVELNDFFLDIDYIISKVEEYNEKNDIDIVLYADSDSFALGDLHAGGMLNSDLSEISSNLIILDLGTMPRENDTFDYFVRVVKLPNDTYKLIAVEHPGDNYIVLVELSE